MNFLKILLLTAVLSCFVPAKTLAGEACYPALGHKPRKVSWKMAVLDWMKKANDPKGLLDKVYAVGFTFQAAGAVLGLVGHADLFKTPRHVVLSTKENWGKMYDFPGPGDYAIWNGDSVSIHYRDGRVETRSNLRKEIEKKSKRLIKNLIEDAIDGEDPNLSWRWTQHEVLYFLFYAFKEYVTAPNPSIMLQHAEKVKVKEMPKDSPWSYKLEIETNLIHTHSPVQEVYLDKQGRIGRITYNFDLMDGGKGIMPIVHDISRYETTADGMTYPTIRRATINWKKFRNALEKLAEAKAEDEADDIIDGMFGPAGFFVSPLMAPITGILAEQKTNEVVEQVQVEYYGFSDFGMKGDVKGAPKLYFTKDEIP